MRDSSILPSAKPTSFLYKTDQSAPRATSYVYNQYLHFAVLEIGFGKHCDRLGRHPPYSGCGGSQTGRAKYSAREEVHRVRAVHDLARVYCARSANDVSDIPSCATWLSA